MENVNKDIIISSSKDKQIKLWNIITQCCFRTIVDYATEIWGISLLRGGDFLAAGSADSSVSIYSLTNSDQEIQTEITVHSGAVIGDVTDDSIYSPLKCNLIGTIKRAGGRGRICNLISDQTGKILAFHGTNDKIIELFVFYSKEEAAARCKKRMKKNNEDGSDVSNVSLTDEVRRLPPINVKSKIKSIDAIIGSQTHVRVAVTLADNSIRVYALNIAEKKPEPEMLKSLHSQGHPSEVRAINFTSDTLALVSADADSIKLWNRPTMKCVRTINGTGYALCTLFAPGDRHCLIGTMSGKLVIVDIVSGDILEEIQAHQKEVWSITMLPGMKGIVTGGGDATVKFWSFELIDAAANEVEDVPEIKGQQVLSLLHTNTLKLEETIQCVGISQNGKFLAVGLLDATVKIFFMDTLKFFLALYGHKLSVLCLDMSDDSHLIATGSADRNVKIWGMDFGDCHRSLFAHEDSVMAVKFVPKTHLFWSCGKDGKIKQWDGDSFVQIQTVPSHLGQAYNLAITVTGHYLLSCGSDRAIRLYERSQEPIILEDMQETEREEKEQQQLATSAEEPTVAGVVAPLNLPSKRTVAAEQAVELLFDALEILQKFNPNEKGESIPLLMRAHNVTNPIDLIVAILARIKPSDLEETLVLLPFTSVCDLLKCLPQIISKRTDQTELLCKVITFLFRIHKKPIIGNQTLLPSIQQMIVDLETAIEEQRDIVGKNLYALKFIQHDIEQNDLANSAELFYDALKAKKQRDRKFKQRQLRQKVSLQLTS